MNKLEGEVLYNYILMGEYWPFKIGWSLTTSVPIAQNDTISLKLISDVAEHTFVAKILEIVHYQIGSVDAGCIIEVDVTRHRAEPLNDKKVERNISFLSKTASLKHKPKLRIV